MKKWISLFLGLPLFFISCSKSNDGCTYKDQNVTAAAAEITALQNYLTTHSIVATQHPSGFFYSISDPGTGATASVCSTISLNYEGILLSNGNVFDYNYQTAGASFVLGQLILGWQKAIPLIKSGGSMTLYIPPSLAYSGQDQYDQQGNVTIPANSYLKFTIHLLDVQ